MKKTEAISILATSVRPREAKGRVRYDEAVKMAIEALKCSEIPKSSDCISRQAAIDAIDEQPTVQPESMSNRLSVANDIKALALINIQDIFRFMITATDAEIEERYGTEARAIEVADKYLDIAIRVDFLQDSIKGWSMTYTQPVKDCDERREYTAYFYDKKDGCKMEAEHE